MLCHRCCRRKIVIILGNGQVSASQKETQLTGSLTLHCRTLNCNWLPAVMLSVSVVHNPAIKDEPFEKVIKWNRWTHIFIYLIHAALWCFSATLCLLFPLSSSSLLFWSLFPPCSHPDIPNCSPKRQSLRCQLVLALLPRTESKGHRGPLSFYCHW